jgi:hypothetical protein
VQSYLVTTPLGVSDAELVSLTLRFDNALHNIVSDAALRLLTAGVEGWNREPLTTGDALLARLAGINIAPHADLRAAIIKALDDRAAVLQFSISDAVPVS